MKPGRYVATAAIPLRPPFTQQWIRAGEFFDILEEDDGLLLVRLDGLRVWKRKSWFEGRALWSYALPAEDRQHTAGPELGADLMSVVSNLLSVTDKEVRHA